VVKPILNDVFGYNNFNVGIDTTYEIGDQGI
jgi:hypothetical protein